MFKKLLFAGLMAAGLCHAQTAFAQHYYGWTRLVNLALTEERGPSGGQCIDVPKGSRQVGTAVAMWTCHDGDNQRFRLKDENFDSTRIAVYSGADERCLGHAGSQSQVVLASCDNAPKWRVPATGEIATADFRYCMAIQADGRLQLVANCNPFDVYAKSRFGSNWGISHLQTPYGPQTVMVNFATLNSCVDVRGGSTTPGTSLYHWPCHLQANQTFQLRGWQDLVYITVYKAGEMLCLSNVGGLGGQRADSTQAVPCNRDDVRQAWHVYASAGGYAGFTFVNYQSGLCLDAYGPPTGYVGAWKCHGGTNQKWGLF